VTFASFLLVSSLWEELKADIERNSLTNFVRNDSFTLEISVIFLRVNQPGGAAPLLFCLQVHGVNQVVHSRDLAVKILAIKSSQVDILKDQSFKAEAKAGLALIHMEEKVKRGLNIK
jgi:hypothetical protein